MENYTNDYEQPQLGMKWFKFMINFALWAGAILNIVMGIQYLTGVVYGETSEWMYYEFPRLKNLDTFYGLALCALAVYQIATRFALAKFKRKGPSMLNGIYIINILLVIIYNIVLSSFMDVRLLAEVSGSVVGTLIWLAYNSDYFKKRKHLFVY